MEIIIVSYDCIHVDHDNETDSDSDSVDGHHHYVHLLPTPSSLFN